VALVHISYAESAFTPYQRLCSHTALKFGCDRSLSFAPDDIDKAFAQRHQSVLSEARGTGYWLWKPYFITRTLAELEEGDMLFYTDAGMHFINSVKPLVTLFTDSSSDLLVLSEGFSQGQYTRRDTFILAGMDSEEQAVLPQRFASAFVLRKSDWSSDFVNEYLALAEDPRALLDQPNELGLPDYPGFVAHRHDQSIFSLLSYKYGVVAVPEGVVLEGLQPLGSQVLNHTRMHQSPGRVATHLLLQGVLSANELQQLSVDL
jgi:hypothetical protein